MKVSPLVLLLVGIAVGGIAFGSCQRTRAETAERQLRESLAAQRDSANRWTLHRDSLTDRLRTLRADSQVLAVRSQQAQRATERAQAEARQFAQRLREAGDTAGARVVLAADSAAAREREGCSLVVLNCEARAENAEERARGDSLLLAQTAILLRQTEAAWRTEQRKNQPGFLGLRAFWKARAYTVPLVAVTTLLLLRR